jgi:hypothetical protein
VLGPISIFVLESIHDTYVEQIAVFFEICPFFSFGNFYQIGVS